MDKTALTSTAINFNHKQTIHKECVKKERKFELVNLKKEYTFSPYTCKQF